MDVVTYALLSGKVSSVESMVTSLAEGFAYKGSVSSVDNLPDDAAAGDLYTVGGKKYVWDGTAWVELKDSVELDATLSTQGKAADAKATGDAIAEVAGDVSDLGDTVTQLSTAITRLKDGQFTVEATFERGLYSGTPVVGQQVNLTPTDNAAWERCKVPIKKDDKLIITGMGSTNTKTFTITNSSGVVLEVATTAAYYSEERIASADGFIYMSVQKSATHSLKIIPLNGYLAVEQETEKTINARIDLMRYPREVPFESGLYACTPVVGQQSTITPTANPAWKRAMQNIKKGETIVIYGTASDITKLFIITDTSGYILEFAQASTATQLNPFTYHAEQDCIVYCSVQPSNPYKFIHYLEQGFVPLLNDANAYTDEVINDTTKKGVFPVHFDFDPSNIPLQTAGTQYNTSDPDDLYDIYDALVTAYPDYVTKVDCSDADTTLGVERPSYLDGLPIYLYKFTPKIVASNASDKRHLKMMILTGVHSSEKWNMFNVANLMKYICEEWDNDANALALRTMVEIWVIPIVNPWGFVHYGEAEYPNAGRCNGNGVNLNRNAPSSDWALSGSGTSDYSGASAGSEYETKIWVYYHDLFSPDVFIDQHTPSMPENGVFGIFETHIMLEYLSIASNYIARQISNNLMKIDSNVPQNPSVALFDSGSDENHGSTSEYAVENGTLYSFIFEMAINSMWDSGTLTSSTVTGGETALMKQEQMQNIYLAWMNLIKCAADYTFHHA